MFSRFFFLRSTSSFDLPSFSHTPFFLSSLFLSSSNPPKIFAAQQYSVELRGYKPLQSWAARHVLEQHSPPGGVLGFSEKKPAPTTEKSTTATAAAEATAAAQPQPQLLHSSLPPPHDVMITNGNNPTLEAILRLFCDRGDDVLCEEYTYPHVAESLALPAGIVPIPVACDTGVSTGDGNESEDDGGGIRPEALDAAIVARVAARPDGKVPKLLYTVPVGQNPTGAVASAERRRKVYEVCRKWGVAIVEDDPYYYLQYGRKKKEKENGGEKQHEEEEQQLGLSNLGASYLSLDADGRVIRLDSFSKVLFPGVRLGWATAPKAVIDKLVCHLHGVALGAPPLAQVLTSALLLRGWGGDGENGSGAGAENGSSAASPSASSPSSSSPFAGFERHVKLMQREYCRRARVASDAADRHLRGLATWRRPSAGMFLWATLTEDLAPLADAALARARAAGVVVVPGAYAHCSGDRARPCASFRLSFAGASDEALEEGVRRLGVALRETREEMTKLR